MMRDIYMVLINDASGAVFVKALDFYRSQNGFVEDWGINWKPFVATSVEDAREQGQKLIELRRLTAEEQNQ